MGYFYAGGKTNQRVNGYGKIGESNQKYLSTRVSQIRHKEGNFVLFQYLEIPNSTKAMTKAIEGHVRWQLEVAGYHNIQNDHFEWKTNSEQKMADYIEFSNKAMFFAEKYCNDNNIFYIRKQGNLNARKTCKHKK